MKASKKQKKSKRSQLVREGEEYDLSGRNTFSQPLRNNEFVRRD